MAVLGALAAVEVRVTAVRGVPVELRERRGEPGGLDAAPLRELLDGVAALRPGGRGPGRGAADGVAGDVGAVDHHPGRDVGVPVAESIVRNALLRSW